MSVYDRVRNHDKLIQVGPKKEDTIKNHH